MPRYIDADAFEVDCRKRYCTGCENYNGIKCKSCWVADMLDETENAPTISPDEVRGVVHCRECSYSEPRKVVGDKMELYCRLFIAGMRRNDFCSHGAKMEVSK